MQQEIEETHLLACEQIVDVVFQKHIPNAEPLYLRKYTALLYELKKQNDYLGVLNDLHASNIARLLGSGLKYGIKNGLHNLLGRLAVDKNGLNNLHDLPVALLRIERLPNRLILSR